jgi:phosphatidylinositol 3-kinase
MRITDWSNKAEARQAIDAMETWETINIEDALELLGKDFTHPAPRQYAVKRLDQV